MQNINDKIEQLAKQLGKPVLNSPVDDYESIRQEYQALANRDVQEQQKNSKRQRIDAIYGRSDLNPKWTFNNIIQDSPDVIEAVNIAQSFIAAHSDVNWRKSSANMMIFYGDYGRGKSHIAGAMAQELINKYEISVLYRQLSSLLEMRFFSYDYSAQDSIGEKFRQTQQELLDVDLLILDEVCVNETVLKQNTQSWLGNLLRQRLADNKNCILITNHSLAKLENALGRYCYESIKEYDTYKVCFTGPSRRAEVSDDEIAESTHDEAVTGYTHESGYVPNQVK